MAKIIVYDSNHPGARQNRCFTKEYATLGPGHNFTVELATEALSRGFEIVTSDVFLQTSYPKGSVAFCITDMHSKNTRLLIKRGVIPFICLSTESPIIARDFYLRMKHRAGKFIHNIQFRGTSERLLTTSTQFSVMYYPIDKRTPLPVNNWREKKFLILVNRNKRMFYSDNSTIKGIIRSLLSRVKVSLQKMIDPWARSRETYRDRVEAIYYFSENPGFHLYGQGWENRIPGFPKSYHQAAKKVYYGSLGFEEKFKVMNQFKFAVCFENCMFPGYVTEKIFDCFISGCIPVYLGAPDIEEFVPPETFIDYRKFKSYHELEHYLMNFSEGKAFQMLNAAAAFLASKDFDKYSTANVVEGILDKLESYEVELNLK